MSLSHIVPGVKSSPMLPRFHLFEFCDQSWLPRSIRQAGIDYLTTVIKLLNLYQPSAAVVSRLLLETNENKIVVLAAGSGGGILDIAPHLPRETEIVLTDLFPD